MAALEIENPRMTLEAFQKIPEGPPFYELQELLGVEEETAN